MHFFDDSLHPENMEKVVITVAPYGPEWMPADFPEDIPVTMEEQIQKAVDCYDAGATVLHLHVRELDGKGSKRLSKFNELIAGVRAAVPDMIIQVGGSISFAPEDDGQAAKWLSDDTRHMLADLEPKPDQVTVAINTTQMNIMELLYPKYLAGTSLADEALKAAYSEMTVRVARELGRQIASGKEAREIYRIGVQYKDADETLSANGMAPNRRGATKTAALQAA
ncbi:3-keto-5-aminohexanoate cleavage protein [Paraburkholderia phytofirmans]|uniref:3-keto-5-aminohexanoate cleavage protein n=1 Tax=Paraburkholderia phytofirmans TaxID=261302 RepID=UPI0038BD1F0E